MSYKAKANSASARNQIILAFAASRFLSEAAPGTETRGAPAQPGAMFLFLGALHSPRPAHGLEITVVTFDTNEVGQPECSSTKKSNIALNESRLVLRAHRQNNLQAILELLAD